MVDCVWSKNDDEVAYSLVKRVGKEVPSKVRRDHSGDVFHLPMSDNPLRFETETPDDLCGALYALSGKGMVLAP